MQGVNQSGGRRIGPAALGLILMLGLSGCVAASKHDTVRQNPTLGQELLDLKAAREAGALTEAEYRSAKEKLLPK